MPSWCQVGSKKYLGRYLGSLGDHLGHTFRPKGVLRASWLVLAPSWERLGASWARLGRETISQGVHWDGGGALADRGFQVP